MKYILPTIILALLCVFSTSAKAQKVDSIFFNLYTDSLKKGTYNYINVDGKYSDGRWQPLTDKQITFTSTGGKFAGNSLFMDKDFAEEKVTVKAVLIADTSIHKIITIYIKKKEDNEKLKTTEEILNEMKQGKPRKQKG